MRNTRLVITTLLALAALGTLPIASHAQDSTRKARPKAGAALERKGVRQGRQGEAMEKRGEVRDARGQKIENRGEKREARGAKNVKRGEALKTGKKP